MIVIPRPFLASIFLLTIVLFHLVILLFQLFDGHNGSAAALYSKENLLNNVLNAIPPELNSDEWISALPRALVAGFVKTDKDFQERGKTSFVTGHFLEVVFNERMDWK